MSWPDPVTAGVVRGPLDPGLIGTGDLYLELAEDEIALLSVRGVVRRTLLGGRHRIVVGDADSCPPGTLIHVLNLGRPLVLSWRHHLPLRAGSEQAAAPKLAAGTFRVRVVDPCAFHRSFLRNRAGEDEDICRDALSHLLPTFLAIHLARGGDDLHDDERLASAVTRTVPSDLDPDLAPYGLACEEIVLQIPDAAPEPQPC